MRRWAFTLLLGISWFVPAVQAQEGITPLGSAMMAYDDAQFAESYALLRPLCDRGHAGAMALMGVLFFHGRGVDQDHAEAALWFYKAARRGNAKGQLAFGTMRWQGVGVSADPSDALKWLMLASASPNDAASTEAQGLIPLVTAELPPDAVARIRAGIASFQPLPHID